MTRKNDRLRKHVWQHYKNAKHELKIRLTALDVNRRWFSNGPGAPHGLDAQVIVSLTSYPPRYPTLHLTLRSLLRQTISPDKVILWIAHDDAADIPTRIKRMQSERFEIRYTEDLRSYKKILPSLDQFPDAYICTADDDLFFWPTWLEELIAAVDRQQCICPCHRAHRVIFDASGAPIAYNRWEFETKFRGIDECLFPTGGAGALYAPGLLTHTMAQRQAALELCPSADDVWLYFVARSNGATFRTVGPWRYLISWPGSQTVSLAQSNVVDGGNDHQIAAMTARFGFPRRSPTAIRLG